MRIFHQLINASASSAPITRNRLPGSNPSRHFPQQEPSRNRAAANDDHVFIPTRLKPVEVPPKHHADCECVRKSEPEHDENKPGQQNARQQQIWLVVPHAISMLRRNTGGVPHNCRNQGWLLKKSLQWQKLPKLGDQKCILRWRKSFIEHPGASSFLCEDAERVFQQPRDITTVKI